jgi:glycosyltransferase involved in cell wall biosynthesis
LKFLCLSVADSVNFCGWIENPEEVGHYYSQPHALVMPTSTHPEEVPRCIDEALVRGIPVVATRIAGVPAEFPEGEVLLVDPSAPARLADGVERILFEPEVRRQYIESAERRRLHWSRFKSAGEQHAMLLKGEVSAD